MKLLVLLSRVPFPLEKGDKLRAYHQLSVLSQFHEIYLVALNDSPLHKEAINKLSVFCKEVHILNISKLSRLWNLFLALIQGRPLQCGYFFSKQNKKQFDKIVEKIVPDHIYCQLVRVMDYVKDCNITKTLDYQDVLSKGMLRRKEKSTFLKKIFFGMEYRRLCKYEQKALSLFDNCTIITAVDRDLIQHSNKQQIEVIANGVDLEQFANISTTKEYDLIFAGNMNYAPNVDAAEYLVKTIIPIIKQGFPNIKLVICGASPSAKVRALASENVIITGWVDSMAEYYSKSRIFIAPMRLGTGLQNKLLEAMATKIPCLTSPLAGFPLKNSENGKNIVICNTPEEYAMLVKKLLNDNNFYNYIANAGYEYVKNNYNWQKSTELLNALICKTKTNN